MRREHGITVVMLLSLPFARAAEPLQAQSGAVANATDDTPTATGDAAQTGEPATKPGTETQPAPHPELMEALVIPRPPGIDDATWQEVLSGFALLKHEFARGLAEFVRGRVDAARDTIADRAAKRDRALSWLRSLDESARAALADDALIWTNPLQFRNATAPRLTGRTLRVGAGGDFAALESVIGELQAGDTVILPAGEHVVPELVLRKLNVSDIALIGQGRGKTTLHVQLSFANRWRLQSLAIDCRDNPFVDLRRGGALHLKDCRIFGYNSGAGGSSATDGSGVVALIEDCVFDGLPGRAAETGRGGVAVGLRSDNYLFARRTHFKDNEEVVRATFPVAFDGCSSETQLQQDGGVVPYGRNLIYIRGEGLKVRDSRAVTELSQLADDGDVIAAALGALGTVGPEARQLAEQLQAQRNVPYWIGLLHDARAEVRRKAARRLHELTGLEVKPNEPDELLDPTAIAQAVSELDAGEFTLCTRAAERLAGAGERAVPTLRALAAEGTLEQRLAAEEVLAAIARGPAAPLAWEIEAARLLTWWEERRDRLVWDEANARYTEGP